MKMTLKKKIAAAAAAATIVGGSGIALAYWTSTGTGVGEATAGTSTVWQVDTDTATGAALTPGGPAQSVALHVTNNSTGHQGLQAVAVSVANPNGTVWDGPGDCDADDFAVGSGLAGATHTITYSTAVNLAPAAVKDDSVTVRMVNKTDANQDACKGADVPLYLAAS